MTCPPNITVRELLGITRYHNISGVPVVEGDNLVGIVTGRDIRFVPDLDVQVREVMTPKDRLVTVTEGRRPSGNPNQITQNTELKKCWWWMRTSV